MKRLMDRLEYIGWPTKLEEIVAKPAEALLNVAQPAEAAEIATRPAKTADNVAYLVLN